MTDERTTAIIVGAGVAGLATADLLNQASCSSITLEARHRAGGRLVSDQHGLDQGASWFWPGEHRVASMVKRFGVATHEQHLDGDAMYDDANQTVRLDGNPIDVASFRFATGADSLTVALTESITDHSNSHMRLDSHVQSVKTNDNGATVTLDTGTTFAADHVVIALPPALAAATIAISPDLSPFERQLIERTPVWMGAITKVVARYRSAFWRADGLSGAAISHRGPMREIHDLSGPDGMPAALFGFASTTSASGPISRSEVLEQLVRIFGDQAGGPVELTLTDWRSETLTSPPEVERLTEYATFGHPAYQQPMLNGRLHWVSTETAPTGAGHIEGALAAAERTAAHIAAH
ncbi:MAG: flavin monoamine oxidase family protein [Ilumatobacter sp.]